MRRYSEEARATPWCYPKRMGKRTRKGRIVFWSLVSAGVVVLLLVLAVAIPNVIVIRAAADYIVKNPEQAPQAQAAIVLGAGVDQNGVPSLMLADRLDIGIKLYKLGKVKKLLLSGDPVQVKVMLEYALARGIPDSDIFTDSAGLNTYYSMYRAANVYQVKSALVVTQGFHVARAVYTARKLGLQAVGVLSDIQPYGIEIGWKVRDWLARVKAVIQLDITHPQPSGLLPVVPIDGDGRRTRG
jgi:SanA protein